MNTKFTLIFVLFVALIVLVACELPGMKSDTLAKPIATSAPVAVAPATPTKVATSTTAPVPTVTATKAVPIATSTAVVPATATPTKVVTTTVPATPTTVLATPVTNTYPALTMADVAPWIAKMGSGGHPGHDVAGNTQCTYWLDPKYIGFADDTGPNTSGVEQTEGVFRFDLEAIATYKTLPTDTVFVAEAAWAKYRGVEYKQSFLITTGRGVIDLSGAAIFAIPNPASVEPFVALRQAHLLCRGYENSIIDFRSGTPVVKYTARVASALVPTVVAPTPTGAPVAIVSATYSFGTLTGSVVKAVCVELKGSGALSIEINSGGFAVSGRESEVTDWQIAKSSSPGKYTVANWTGWLLCFDETPVKAEALLVSTDPNAKSNQRVEWVPAKK